MSTKKWFIYVYRQLKQSWKYICIWLMINRCILYQVSGETGCVAASSYAFVRNIYFNYWPRCPSHWNYPIFILRWRVLYFHMVCFYVCVLCVRQVQIFVYKYTSCVLFLLMFTLLFLFLLYDSVSCRDCPWIMMILHHATAACRSVFNVRSIP